MEAIMKGRLIKNGLICVFVVAVLVSCASAGRMHAPAELIEDADLALQLLKEGNERYVQGKLVAKNSYAADREILNSGQKPFAVVLTCSDSRAAPEIFFDQKLGDIFTIRNAGNVADTTALGSLEYAVEHLKAPLVVVIGHSKCGAVTAAHEGGELPPNIAHIVGYIKPAVARGGDVDEAINANVEVMVDKIKEDAIVEHLGVTVVGAYYDIHTGEVTWL
jgi:carbonic anhydrase